MKVSCIDMTGGLVDICANRNSRLLDPVNKGFVLASGFLNNVKISVRLRKFDSNTIMTLI